MKRIVTLVIGLALAAVPAAAQTGNAEIEKTLIANERAVVGAVMKADVATFQKYVAADSWGVDPMGRTSTAEFIKMMPQMKDQVKITKWDISDFKVIWAGTDTAIVSYKWTGTGTFMGMPAKPAWATTVWTKRDGKWLAQFHQETEEGPPPPPAKK